MEQRVTMNKKDIAIKAIKALKQEYPEAFCSLDYKDPLQLLIATRLAAQCTDARVNIVTPALFDRFKNVDDFAKADPSEVEQYVKSCGFYKTKANDIVNMCKKIICDFNSKVPDTMEELTSLPGVGRKTASIILGDIFSKPAIPVDTHCLRLTLRLGLHNQKDPKKIEFELKKILPPEESSDFCHRLVLHGRAICKARKPLCLKCIMKDFCSYYQKTVK